MIYDLHEEVSFNIGQYEFSPFDEKNFKEKVPKYTLEKLEDVARSRTIELLQVGEESINAFSDDNFLSDILEEYNKESSVRKSLVELEKEYRLYLKQLENSVFTLDFLLNFNLKELKKIAESIEALRQGLLEKNISSGDVADLCDHINLTIKEALSQERSIWPQDKIKGENCEDFLRRVWGDRIFSDNPIMRSDLRKQPHYSLYKALGTHFARKGVPDDLSEWWNKSPLRKKSEIDALLESNDIQKPEDAYRRNLPEDEAQRLYNARKFRMHHSE